MVMKRGTEALVADIRALEVGEALSHLPHDKNRRGIAGSSNVDRADHSNQKRKDLEDAIRRNERGRV